MTCERFSTSGLTALRIWEQLYKEPKQHRQCCCHLCLTAPSLTSGAPAFIWNSPVSLRYIFLQILSFLLNLLARGLNTRIQWQLRVSSRSKPTKSGSWGHVHHALAATRSLLFMRRPKALNFQQFLFLK